MWTLVRNTSSNDVVWMVIFYNEKLPINAT